MAIVPPERQKGYTNNGRIAIRPYTTQKKLPDALPRPATFFRIHVDAYPLSPYICSSIISFTFISRTLVALSFSSSFISIYLIFRRISGIITYYRALTRRRVFSISSARSCMVFSTSASSTISANTAAMDSTALSSSPLVWAKP